LTRLRDFSVLTFDCYGTLIDWETGIWDALQPLIHGNGDAPITRTQALGAFAELESAQQAATPAMPYPELLARVHAEFARRFRLETDTRLDAAFGASVPHWPAFADSAEGLRALGQRFRLVILSNVDRRGFEASNRKLGVDFDAVYTAEDIGSYKPDPRNFHYLRRQLEEDFGIAADQVLHTAQSLFHDHVPAQNAGLARAWIDRQQLSRGGHWGATARVPQRPEVNFTFYSLAELAAAVDNDD
jgi:2-haloalkanoic acid dehalogenase type II